MCFAWQSMCSVLSSWATSYCQRNAGLDQQTTTLPLLLAPLLSEIVFNTDVIKMLHTWAVFRSFNVYLAGLSVKLCLVCCSFSFYRPSVGTYGLILNSGFKNETVLMLNSMSFFSVKFLTAKPDQASWLLVIGWKPVSPRCWEGDYVFGCCL